MADLGQVKQNVATMVSKGAPENDIDSYINAEGTTIDAIKNFKVAPTPQASTGATGALSQAQGKSIPQQAAQGLTDAPGVYAKELGGMANAVTHPLDTLGVMANAAFNHPIDNLVNSVKQNFGSYDKAYNTLYNNPISTVSTLAGIQPGIAGAKALVANPQAVMGDMAKSGVGQAIGNVGDRMTGLPKDYAPIIAKNANEFQQILNPGKPELQALTKTGKDISDPMKLAAQEQLILGKNSSGKLDTTAASESLKPKINSLDDTLQSYLDSIPGVQFSIDDLKSKVLSAIPNTFPNAKEAAQARTDLQSYLDAEHDKFGSDNLSAGQLNQFKRGMWSVSFNGLAPNANKLAKVIGGVAQQEIEKAFPDGQIGMVNKAMGQYLTLQKLLDNANGRIIPGGKIGNYGAKATGMVAGATLHKLPIIGPVLGHALGGAVDEFMSDPTRRTMAMAQRMKGYQGSPLQLPLRTVPQYQPTFKGKRLPNASNQQVQ